ncbi:hypothetical protein [Corynebacterium lizhenjunii]|uniref:hypothetical protein n=1 Tax=Corynebacterium lizhenjunii TaxID=2709394 RepID=UPI0013E9E4C9|nr:hypothetical protein [Corynebacterium lizhenjunii]
MGFHETQFLAEMAIPLVLLVLIGTPVVRRALRTANRTGDTGARRRMLVGSAKAALCGFIPPVVWLSWNSTTTFWDTYRYGAPTQFPVWQIVACGVTLGLLGVYLNLKVVKNGFDIALYSLMMGTGFALAFSLGLRASVASQDGIGTVLAFVGIGLAAFVFSKVIQKICALVIWVRDRRARLNR